MTQPYKHPPIIEAAIEIRYDGDFDADVLIKATRRIEEYYMFNDKENMINVIVDDGPRPPRFDQKDVFRLTSLDRTDITILRPNSFVCARLAPYSGWEHLRERTERDWTAWSRSAKGRRIVRVGVRYINRIDVPMAGAGAVAYSDYMAIAPNLPDWGLPPISGFTAQVVQPLGKDGYNALFNTATVASPLLNHASFMLDIDLSQDGTVPQRPEDLWPLLDEMRTMKNRLFEASVTDRARALFDQ